MNVSRRSLLFVRLYGRDAGKWQALRFRNHMRTRPYTTNPSKSTPQSRMERVNSRLPRFLQRWTSQLFNAPASTIVSFLILHEITAIVPLVGLFGVFHFGGYLPPYISEWKWASDGVEKFGRYFRRKGWLGDEDAKREKWWRRGESTTKIIAEVAAAYAITKALLPVRIPLSVALSPWFARTVVIPSARIPFRLFKRKAKPAPAAGTGATGGNTIDKKL